ncbi:hypothetical protein GYMLUDRAFT_674379 [Collybiopsis luxurians FD-317 M1]|uniref:Uncharacterized protein n=1 Tax=Collybiopsis luxurians FD-317 M1 TaxID=944289 RepID=A0A0D0CM16_9AGAR|nr:hypothetical protein GYMLUDRAFT_674379 [Collybiopsis luxurians FD-317 M1]
MKLHEPFQFPIVVVRDWQLITRPFSVDIPEGHRDVLRASEWLAQTITTKMQGRVSELEIVIKGFKAPSQLLEAKRILREVLDLNVTNFLSPELRQLDKIVLGAPESESIASTPWLFLVADIVMDMSGILSFGSSPSQFPSLLAYEAGQKRPHSKIASDADPNAVFRLQYSSLIIHTKNRGTGKFHEDDILLNDIHEAQYEESPLFAQVFYTQLQRKRHVSQEMNLFLKSTVLQKVPHEKIIRDSYLIFESPLSDELPHQAPEIPVPWSLSFDEWLHLQLCATSGDPKEFGEKEFKILVYDRLVKRYELPHYASRGHRLSKTSSESWPLSMVVGFEDNHSSYRPKSDWRMENEHGFICLTIEVDSFRDDWQRLRLQAAFLVRFANLYLRANKREPNFVLLAIFLHRDGMVTSCTFFEEKGSVFYLKKEYDLKDNTLILKTFIWRYSSTTNFSGAYP